jgi:hypothetical protein
VQGSGHLKITNQRPSYGLVIVADCAKALAYQDGRLSEYDAGETYGFTVRAEELLGIAIEYAGQRRRR